MAVNLGIYMYIDRILYDTLAHFIYSKNCGKNSVFIFCKKILNIIRVYILSMGLSNFPFVKKITGSLVKDFATRKFIWEKNPSF